MDHKRAYLDSHPFIDFSPDVMKGLTYLTWAHLGESYSKLRHLAGTPLKPGVALQLSKVYMRRGALSSAAIEGNTLSEDQVEGIYERNEVLPESQLYLQQEVENVLKVLLRVRRSAATGESFALTPAWIKQVHTEIYSGLPTSEDVVPGVFRSHTVGVGNYRAVPPEDVEFLVARFCVWVEELRTDAAREASDDLKFFKSFVIAVLAHVYLAWIHPFGDGNGRTARAIECAVLAHAGGVPWVSTVLLSDYYNRTRTEYYRRLDAASRAADLAGFVAYSAVGFRDELRLQIADVQRQQRAVAWTDYVHEQFSQQPSTDTTRRRRLVALAMPDGKALGRREIRYLWPEIAELYESTSERLFRRDMNKLIELKLVRQAGNKYQSAIDLIDAFMPRPEHGSNMPYVVMPDEYLIDDEEGTLDLN